MRVGNYFTEKDLIVSELDSGIALDDFQKKFAEQAANPDPLHPDLAEYLIRGNPDSRLKWDALKHPLVFGVPYTPGLNFLYNQQFEAKTKALTEYIAEENWGGYIFMHERPYRFDAFDAVIHFNKLDGPKYWDLLSSVWSDSENLWQVGMKRIRKLFSLYPDHRDSFMDEDEKKLLQSLPDQIKVFRGHQSRNQKGFSWTLDYTKAVWFGQRYTTMAGQARVSQGVVQKSDIIGLVLGRNEKEVVVDPRHVHFLHEMTPISRSEES